MDNDIVVDKNYGHGLLTYIICQVGQQTYNPWQLTRLSYPIWEVKPKWSGKLMALDWAE